MVHILNGRPGWFSGRKRDWPLGARSIGASIVGSLLVFLVVVPVHGQATFMGLGLFGGEASKATDVSADGSVVVGIVNTVNGLDVFRWSSGQSVVRTEAVGEPVAVSSDGSVVVGRYITPEFAIQAFRWPVGAGFEGLGDFPGGGSTSEALDVSSDGSVIVGYGTTATGDEAFRWTRQTGMVGLGTLPGVRRESVARGVSADGTVVVGHGSTAGPGNRQAFRWTPDTGMAGLGFLPGALDSTANQVSADGSVVVGFNLFTDPDRLFEAFRWTAETGMVGLGDLPGGTVASNALGVSGDGSIVVGYGLEGFGIGRAAIWTPQTGMLNLQNVLLSAGTTGLDGWILTEATAISPDGLTIVGVGDHNGQTEAWVATIPEPSTLALAVIATTALLAIGIGRLRRSRSVTAMYH